jgi:ABC-type dipeptide/oligopeptide/nickel transport system permease subunit
MSAAQLPITVPASLAPPLHSRIASMFTALWRSRGAVRFGMVVLASMLLMSLLAPWISPYDVNAQDMYNMLAEPSAKHWLGTDNLGRDLLTRIIWGGQVPLMVAALATLLAAAIGIGVGLISGMAGGWLDALLMRTADAFICFPPLLFVLVLSAIIGPGIHNVIISFAVFGWTGFARITRGQVMLVRELQYIEAARAIGMSRSRLLRLHVLPNVLAPLIVASSLTAGGAILVEAAASFLGVGVQPPAASWGQELYTGFRLLEQAPQIAFASGTLVTLAVLAFNYLGDGLRDLLDPRVGR